MPCRAVPCRAVPRRAALQIIPSRSRMPRQTRKLRIKHTINFHKFPSGKEYLYIDQPSGERVFIRNILFIHAPDDPKKIALVHEWGKNPKKEYEPPKGQMEWKEAQMYGASPNQSVTETQLMKMMKAAVIREIGEEAKFTPRELKGVHPLPLVYEQSFKGAPLKKDRFRYQFWSASVSETAMKAAQQRIQALVDDPEGTARLKADLREKDGLVWWNPTDVESWSIIRNGFSKNMTHQYYDNV